MKIIQPSYEILTSLNREGILKHLEICGRTCYKSEDKITDDSASKFVSNLVKRGHLAMIEFFDIQVRFIHNRGFSHEVVRHRLCSFAQESTRYVDYKNDIQVIQPYWMDESFMDRDDQNYCLDVKADAEWKKAIYTSITSYMNLRAFGYSPQAARGVLPNDIKTEIVVKANLREWKTIFELRCPEAAHPDMRRIMIPLREEFRKILPEIYG